MNRGERGATVSERDSFTLTSSLPAAAEQVWTHASSFQGVNQELLPWVFMTCPRSARTITPETVPLGEPAFRSWLLLFGVLPIDYDDLRLEELTPGRGFAEDSQLWSARVWQHRRTIEPAEGGCTLTDEVCFEPRVGWTAPMLGWIYRAVFRWRHYRLQQIFGATRRIVASETLLVAATLLMMVALASVTITLANASYAGVLVTALTCTLLADTCCLVVFLRGGWVRWVTLLVVLPSLFVYSEFLRRSGAVFGN